MTRLPYYLHPCFLVCKCGKTIFAIYLLLSIYTFATHLSKFVQIGFFVQCLIKHSVASQEDKV